MARIRVDLESVQVIEGQGIGEGDFELRIQVQEGGNDIIWPSLNGSTKVDKGGAAQSIGKEVATYTVTAPLSKRFTIDVTEVDKGTLGQDDQGQATLNFDLTPTMTPTTQSATISLKRPNMNFHGKVKVTMTAQQA
ncbi:MAG TPA: hypothetical protein VGO91_06455 [Pyrinomonadaceae bacterium]|nr:hypothetical protein [Pyrinomonadaceae bacterium]